MRDFPFFPLRSGTFLNVNFPVVFHLSANNCTHSKFIYYIIYPSMLLVHTHAHSLMYTKDEYVYAHTFFSFVLYPFISLPSLPVYAVSLECCLCIIYVSLCSAIKMVRSFQFYKTGDNSVTSFYFICLFGDIFLAKTTNNI